MQQPVGRKHTRGRESDLAIVEIGEFATRLAHDDGERSDVENVDIGLDDDIQRAARQQVVVHEVAVAAHPTDTREERTEAVPMRWLRKALDVTGGEEGLLERRDRTHLDALVVEIRTAATLSPGELTASRCIRDAEHQL